MPYIYNGFDITNYFRLEATVKKTIENPTSDSFSWNFLRKVYARINKFQKVVWDNSPHKSAGYDVVSCFWSTVKYN